MTAHIHQLEVESGVRLMSQSMFDTCPQHGALSMRDVLQQVVHMHAMWAYPCDSRSLPVCWLIACLRDDMRTVAKPVEMAA